MKITDNTELHDAIILQEWHNKKLQLFRETLAVESILKSQIIASIDPIYLKDLKNTTTETITYTIPFIFTYLFQNFGQVSPQQLQGKELKVQNMAYNINNPPIIILHFSEAHNNLCKIRGRKMQNTPYHQANQAIQK